MKIIIDISDRLARIIECGNSTVTQQLEQIQEKLNKIMGLQEDFDAKINAANVALDEIALAVASEAQQIRDFIEAHPQVDTSALDGVLTRLEGVNESIGGVFEPAPVEPPVEP